MNLHNHFYNEDENSNRLTGYVPIRAHREAFLALVKSQLPDPSNKDKVFMLTGSFGTGKSHLCLMLANYFSRKASSPEMQVFFENWAKRDQAGASQVRNMRGEGRYLVAICEYGEGKPFEDMLLSSIEEALKIEGAENVEFDTHYKGALRQIKEWEERREFGGLSGTFNDFLHYLDPENPETALDDLKKGLSSNNSKAMEIFHNVYEKTTLQGFTMRADSLNDVLRDLLHSQSFKQRYRGLVILADEFGYTLSDNLVKMSVFQSFAEMSKDGVDGMPIIFIGTGHRRFEAYGAHSQDNIDFRVVKDRVTEVSLQSEELEQIIAALVSPRKETSDWKQIESNWLLSKMAGEIKKTDARKVKLFDYLTEPMLLDQIVENIYPMHPLAVYCLTRISQELGSDARSVFSFFRRTAIPAPGGYLWYVNENETHKPNGDLNIYTCDLLVKYFQPEINTSNLSVRVEIHDHIRNYSAALEEAQKIARNTFSGEINAFTQSVLDLMFIYRVSGIPVTYNNLAFGLNIYQGSMLKQLESELKSLLDTKVIFRGTSGEFEFRRSNMADVDALIDQSRLEVGSRTLNLAEQMAHLAEKFWETWTIPSEHNSNYHGDKRLRRIFATPQDLLRKYTTPDGGEVSNWQQLERERTIIKNWNERYDGTMVYVLCETQDDILTAQQAVKSNDLATIIVGIPQVPIPVKEKMLDLLAVQEFMSSLEYNKLDLQEKSIIVEMLGKEGQKSGRIGEFMKVRERYLQAKGLNWYQKDGKVLVSNPNSDHEPADALMSIQFKKRNTAEHTILNLAHPKTFPGAKDNALREAVARLIAFEHPVEIDNNEKENQGEIRYLRNVLVNNGVLRQTGDYVGSNALYQLETNQEIYQNKFPALVELVQTLRLIGRGEKYTIWPKLQDFIESPYGLGPYSLSLFMAVAVRFLGDEMRLKLSPAGLGYAQLNDPEVIIDLATGKYPYAAIERRERTPEMTELIDRVYSLFSETPFSAGSHCSQIETWQVTLAWWKKCTRLEKTSGIYPENSTTQKLVGWLTNSESNLAANQSFVDDLKNTYGYSYDAALDTSQVADILEKLKQDKSIIELRSESIKDFLVTSIGRLFASEGKTYLDYTEAIRNWVTSLHPDQVDKYASWQQQSTLTLIDALPKLVNIEKTLLEDIPEAPGFAYGKVDNWNYDRSDDYIKRFRDALKRIENGLPKVPPPVFSTAITATTSALGEPLVTFYGKTSLIVTAPDGVTVRVTKEPDPKIANEFVPIGSGTTWTCDVTESCSYYMISQSAQGEFSKQIKIVFRNLDDDYRLRSETQVKLEPNKRFYNFRNPTDKQGLVVLLRSLVQQLTIDGSISPDDIRAAFLEVLERPNKPSGEA